MIITIIILVLLIMTIVIRFNNIFENSKRFQESNKLEQLFRYRFYIKVPFKWLYYSVISKFKVYIDKIGNDGNITHTNEYDIIRGRTLWGLLKSSEQSNMKWYYTMDEVMGKIDKLKHDKKND